MIMISSIIDFETTGFGNTAKIIEFAIITFDNEFKILSKIESLINPGIEIPDEITKINGISNGMVKDAPLFNIFSGLLLNIFEKQTIVGHNISFDVRMFSNNIDSEVKIYNKICTLKMFKNKYNMDSYKLNNICKDLKIKHDNNHRAMGDCLATFELFKKLNTV